MHINIKLIILNVQGVRQPCPCMLAVTYESSGHWRRSGMTFLRSMSSCQLCSQLRCK